MIRFQLDFADFAPEIKSYKSGRLCLFVSGERGEAFWMKPNYSEQVVAKPSYDAVWWIHVFAFLIFEIMVMACLSTFQGHAIIICLWHLFHGMFLVAVHSTCDVWTDMFYILSVHTWYTPNIHLINDVYIEFILYSYQFQVSQFPRSSVWIVGISFGDPLVARQMGWGLGPIIQTIVVYPSL